MPKEINVLLHFQQVAMEGHMNFASKLCGTGKRSLSVVHYFQNGIQWLPQ